MLLGRGEIGTAMVDAVDGGGGDWRRTAAGIRDAHFDGVDFAIVIRWSEGETVFVADELGDFGVGGGELLGVFGEIGAATGGFRNQLQQMIGFGKFFCGHR